MESSISDIAQTEYEVQFYGFSRASVVKGVKDLLDDVVVQILDSVEKKLKDKYDSSTATTVKSNLLIAYRKSIEQHTEQLTATINKYFQLPPGVVLPEDELQKTQYTKEDEAEVAAELKTCRDKLTMRIAFEKELEAIVKSVAHIEDVLESVNDLLSQCESFSNDVDEFNKKEELGSITSLLNQLLANLKLVDNQ